jgi:hypothetical protein
MSVMEEFQVEGASQISDTSVEPLWACSSSPQVPSTGRSIWEEEGTKVGKRMQDATAITTDDDCSDHPNHGPTYKYNYPRNQNVLP